MHWMFSHCSDRDASPNSSLEITSPGLAVFARVAEQQLGTEGHCTDMKLDRSRSCHYFYYPRQCRSTERKKDRREGEREKAEEKEREGEREMLAHVLAADGLLWSCMCVCMWVGARVLALQSDGDLVQD